MTIIEAGGERKRKRLKQVKEVLAEDGLSHPSFIPNDTRQQVGQYHKTS
jgi:hypothetical protein